MDTHSHSPLSETSHNSSPLVFVLVALVITALWGMLVHQALYSAGVIWIGNEIFNHCALVIPASIYLIWERRKEIDWAGAHSSKLALFFLFGQLLLFLLGVAGDIQLFQHVAVFSMLPTLFWCFVGNSIAWQLKFPYKRLPPISRCICCSLAVFHYSVLVYLLKFLKASFWWLKPAQALVF